MKKTCLFFLIGFLLAAVSYFWLIRHFVPEIHPVASAGIAVLGAFSLLALFGAISKFIEGLSDKFVITRATNREPFRDGKRAAAIGRIEASGLATITAPFSGRDCLGYEYEVYEIFITKGTKGGKHESKQSYCSGYGLIPSHVRTPQGDVRMLGFPLLDEFQEDFTESGEDRARAGAFIARTQFHNIKKNIGNIFSEFDDLFQDADGAVRKDLGEPVTLHEKHRLTEKIIPRGVEVCAIGVFSQRENALIAKTAALPIRLIPGNPQEVERRLRKAGIGQIAFALIFFCFINGIFAFVYHRTQEELYNIPLSEQWSEINRTAEARDFEKLKKLFQKGLNPDATDSHSRTLLQTTNDDEVARLLLQHGANANVQDPATLETPLFEAARKGDLERIRILLEAGADVNAVSEIPWKHTPIDEAIRTGRSEAINKLIEGGAKDPLVNAANGRPLTPDGGEQLAVCRKYLQAIQNLDKHTMKSITTPRYDSFFEDINLPVWKPVYPVEIETFEGYTNDKAATVQLRGRRSDGRDTEWIYQLHKQPDGWKIHQTWPLSGEGYEVLWR
jgi:hypothetical protein